MDDARSTSQKTMIGWREWLCLPELGIDFIKAKIDTGARTSALHTFSLDVAHDGGRKVARFGVHPWQRDTDTVVWCTAPVVDERSVRDSGGRKEWRFVIATPVAIAQRQWEIELTLTARDTMLFRMLVGRTAMRSLCVDPFASFVAGPGPGEQV